MKYLVQFRKFSDVDFPFLIFILYFIGIVLLLLQVGFKNWDYVTLLPLGNVGPFMFFTLPFLFVLPKKIRKYYLTLVALLSPAMLIYGLMRGVVLIATATKSYATYVIDIICHTLFSLYGVYLVRSEQVDIDIKHSLISSAIILVVALFMLALNAIFHTHFFGLSLYGDHSIYSLIFLDSAALSVLLYFVLLVVALGIGYLFQKYLGAALKALSEARKEQDSSPEEAPNDTDGEEV